MRKILIKKNNVPAAYLEERPDGYYFESIKKYDGYPVSFTLKPQESCLFKDFPVFLEGLLPEGIMLEGLLKREKIDRKDYMSQLIAVGEDLVGDLTVEEIKNE